MKKVIAVILISSILVMCLAGCSGKYKEKDFLGKTSAEIEKEYGKFDCIIMPVSEDGLYRNCRCGYTIKKAQKGYLGTSPEIFFFIHFDGNGIAISCDEGYRPGG